MFYWQIILNVVPGWISSNVYHYDNKQFESETTCQFILKNKNDWFVLTYGVPIIHNYRNGYDVAYFTVKAVIHLPVITGCIFGRNKKNVVFMRIEVIIKLLVWILFSMLYLTRIQIYWLLLAQFEGILPKGPYLPCVSMAGRALLAGYHRIINIIKLVTYRHLQGIIWTYMILCTVWDNYIICPMDLSSP